jgi:hypothetical protein
MVVASVAASGCGNAGRRDGIAKAKVVRDADGICRRSYERALALGQAYGTGSLAYYDRLIPALQSELSELAELTPDTDVPTFRRVVAADRVVLNDLTAYVAAQRAHRGTSDLEVRTANHEATYVRLAKAFGLKVCGTQE